MWYYMLLILAFIYAMASTGILRAIWDLYRAPKRGERNDN